MSNPAFLQFANHAKSEVEKWEAWVKSDTYDGEGLEAASQEAAAFAKQAERHARLLAAVWEWANDNRNINTQDEVRCKAHVRALLAQTEEK